MTQISVKDVVPQAEVNNVRPETKAERIIRALTEFFPMITSSAIVFSGFVVLIVVLYSENPIYVKYHDAAWSLIITMIGAALGYMVANKSSLSDNS